MWKKNLTPNLLRSSETEYLGSFTVSNIIVYSGPLYEGDTLSLLRTSDDTTSYTSARRIQPLQRLFTSVTQEFAKRFCFFTRILASRTPIEHTESLLLNPQTNELCAGMRAPLRRDRVSRNQNRQPNQLKCILLIHSMHVTRGLGQVLTLRTLKYLRRSLEFIHRHRISPCAKRDHLHVYLQYRYLAFRSPAASPPTFQLQPQILYTIHSLYGKKKIIIKINR